MSDKLSSTSTEVDSSKEASDLLKDLLGADLTKSVQDMSKQKINKSEAELAKQKNENISKNQDEQARLNSIASFLANHSFKYKPVDLKTSGGTKVLYEIYYAAEDFLKDFGKYAGITEPKDESFDSKAAFIEALSQSPYFKKFKNDESLKNAYDCYSELMGKRGALSKIDINSSQAKFGDLGRNLFRSKDNDVTYNSVASSMLRTGFDDVKNNEILSKYTSDAKSTYTLLCYLYAEADKDKDNKQGVIDSVLLKYQQQLKVPNDTKNRGIDYYMQNANAVKGVLQSNDITEIDSWYNACTYLEKYLSNVRNAMEHGTSAEIDSKIREQQKGLENITKLQSLLEKKRSEVLADKSTTDNSGFSTLGENLRKNKGQKAGEKAFTKEQKKLAKAFGVGL